MNPYPAPPAWAADITSIGVTGTNGKSSTTRFAWAGLNADARGPVGRVTTVDMAIGDELHEPPINHAHFLAAMQALHARGGRRAAIEATSATLALGFARAWPMSTAVFTNLGLDHMRTHGTPEHYLAAKAQLFVNLPQGGVAVLNADDGNAELIAEVVPPGVRVLWYGTAQSTRALDLCVRAATSDRRGALLELDAKPELAIPQQLRLRGPASFQAANAAAALLACIAVGVPGPVAAEAIAACEAPRGRFEWLASPPDRASVVIDYAHTPEALTAVLTDARALTTGRVLLVIGAGGDTDPGKREPLGRAASSADVVWLTSDNPRHEDPQQIVEHLQAGVAGTEVRVELDRGRAIALALTEARPEDLVLIAGKGHERGQTIGDQTIPCRDHDLVAAAWARDRA